MQGLASMWKEYQLVIKAIRKRYISWQSCCINGVRPRCKASPVQNFVEYPRPGLSDNQKTRRLSMKSGEVIKVKGSWKGIYPYKKLRLTKNWSFGVWSALDVTLLSKLYQTHQVFKHPIYERLYFRGEAETSWGDVFPNWMKRSSHVHAENDNENAYRSSFSEVRTLLKNFRQFQHKISYRIRLSSFFLRLASSDQTKFLGFWKKK